MPLVPPPESASEKSLLHRRFERRYILWWPWRANHAMCKRQPIPTCTMLCCYFEKSRDNSGLSLGYGFHGNLLKVINHVLPLNSKNLNLSSELLEPEDMRGWLKVIAGINRKFPIFWYQNNPEWLDTAREIAIKVAENAGAPLDLGVGHVVAIIFWGPFIPPCRSLSGSSLFALQASLSFQNGRRVNKVYIYQCFGYTDIVHMVLFTWDELCQWENRNTMPLYTLHWLPVSQRIKFKVLLIIYKAQHGYSPVYTEDLLTSYTPSRQLRSSDSGMLEIPFTRSSLISNATLSHAGARLWNSLPVHLRRSPTIESFKADLKTFLFKEYFT